MSQDLGYEWRFAKPTPVVGVTLVVLVAVFVVTAITERLGVPLYDALALHPHAVLHGAQLWSVLTWPLLHSLDDITHLLFNGMVLYFFGPALEERWGKGRFVLFMVLAALGSGAFVLGATALGLQTAGRVVGFSGVTMGITMAWGLTFPDREMFFFFVRLKGLHLVYVTLAFQVLGALAFDGVSSSAHFGGMAVGALYAAVTAGPIRRWWLRRRLAHLDKQRSTGQLRYIRGGADTPKDKRDLN